MRHFYERNDYLLDHEVNKTFEEILWMSDSEFCKWCVELRKVVVYAWDELGIPPRVGYNEQEIIDQFKQLASFPVKQFLVKDKLTGKKDTIKNTRIEGNAVNQWFPTMMKTPINYTTDPSKGRSIYDFFARDDLLDRFITYASRHFKRDSFYHYSLPAKVLDAEHANDLPCWQDGLGWILDFEKNFRSRGEYDYWLAPKDIDAEYTGYNEDIKTRKFLTICDTDIITLGKLIPFNCQTNILYKDTDNYQIRVFKLGQKLFPIGLKAFRVSFCQYATNFPPLTAKFIYETFCPEGSKSIVWDPSMGWGGRLIGAMSVKDDRHITYLGNDPNQDHLINGSTKYHDIYNFYCKNIRKGGLWQIDHNDMRYWCKGSEEMQYDPTFIEYKGLIDLVFTSPPYFMKEAYSEDENQSYKKFGNWESWVTGFLYPTLATAYQWLKDGGHLCWNVSDVKFGNDVLPLVETSMNICQKLGFHHKTTLKMCLAAMPGGNRMEKGIPKTKYFVQVDDMYHKYEPCLVFQK